jgi:thymidylate synthase (FAD)
MVRHRVSWQELSRRYVGGERVPFEFYISEKMKNIKSLSNCYGYECTTENIIDICLDHYKQALKQGVKPQEARRIIPQAAYTQIWGAFMPKQLDNYFKLRLDEHSQWEIRQTAIAMRELINDKVGIETYV